MMEEVKRVDSEHRIQNNLILRLEVLACRVLSMAFTQVSKIVSLA